MFCLKGGGGDMDTQTHKPLRLLVFLWPPPRSKLPISVLGNIKHKLFGC